MTLISKWIRKGDNVSRISKLPGSVLEKIFGYLPVKDVVRCQRVCLEWDLVLSASEGNHSFQPQLITRLFVCQSQSGRSLSLKIFKPGKKCCLMTLCTIDRTEALGTCLRSILKYFKVTEGVRFENLSHHWLEWIVAQFPIDVLVGQKTELEMEGCDLRLIEPSRFEDFLIKCGKYSIPMTFSNTGGLNTTLLQKCVKKSHRIPLETEL